MSWYRWKFWRLAWSCNAGGRIEDAAGEWRSLFGSRLFVLSWRRPQSKPWQLPVVWMRETAEPFGDDVDGVDVLKLETGSWEVVKAPAEDGMGSGE